MLENLHIDEDNPNVQEIMLQIRGIIIEQKLGREGMASQQFDRFSGTVYDQLFQAMVSYDQASVEAFVSSTSIPLLGPLVQRFRRLAHNLVLFYLARLSEKQILFNEQLVRTVDGMLQDLEAEPKPAAMQAQIAALQEQVTKLEAQLAHLGETKE